MLEVRYSAKFKKDYKTVIKRGYNPQPGNVMQRTDVAAQIQGS